jgi:carotenoid cleavage dioxygenase-like enzyme
MHRRHFMAGLTAAPLLAAHGLAAAGNLYWKPFRDSDDIDLLSPDTAWKSSFRRVPAEMDCEVTMRVPAGLRGTLYRNGPALMNLAGTRYRHWLDGDGMVHALRLQDGKLVHRGRMIGTRKLQAEMQAGKRLAPGFGTSLPGTAVRGPDDMNTANINTLMVNGELLALWEGGVPYAMAPATLQTKGRKVFAPQVDNLPFSAHPRVDAAGHVWSFGYLPGAGALALYELDNTGALRRQGFVPTANADMVHDFAMTERYLVFVLMPYRYQPRPDDPALSFVGHYAWQAGQPGQVLVVDKADFKAVRLIDIPARGVFHLGNAWEEGVGGNTLRFGTVSYDDFPDFMRRAGDVMDHSLLAYPGTRWTEHEVDLAAGTVRSASPFAGTVEFPRFDPRRIGRASRCVYLMGRQGGEGELFGFNTVRRFDQRTAHLQEYRYGPGVVAEEHVFVPAPGTDAEERGWLVGTSYDWRQRRTTLSVFDAAAVADGPLAQATLPYALPLGIHGQFVAAAGG